MSDRLLTANEFAQSNGTPRFTELVNGRVVPGFSLDPRQKQVCTFAIISIGSYVNGKGLGTVLSGAVAVQTTRSPDTLRLVDVAYYSAQRVPRRRLGPYVLGSPNLVIDVLGHHTDWTTVHKRTAELLANNVNVVCILDSETQRMHVYRDDLPPQILQATDHFSADDVVPGYSPPITDFFPP